MSYTIHSARHLLLTVAVIGGLVPAVPVAAQSFSLGADFVSPYIWRGTDFGESASLQPALSYSHSGFEIGSWASYALDPSAAGVNEHDLWLSYSVETTSGTISLGVTDYYFPNAGADFFDFDGDGQGAHWIEPYISYTGPASLPISLYGGVFVHNDPDNSIYLSASYPFAVDGVDLSFTTSASAGESALYGTSSFGIVELNLSASKAIAVTEHFALPITVAYIMNPYHERSYLVLGVSL